MDSETVLHGRQLATGILGSPNHVRAVLNVKLLRHTRVAVPQTTMGPLFSPRTVGENTFSDELFLGDAAPANNETLPISGLLFLLYRRDVAQPTIALSTLGPCGPYRVGDDPNLAHPGVPVAGGVGPYVQGDANFSINIPWADLYFCPNGVTAGITAALVAAPAAGITYVCSLIAILLTVL